MGCIKRAITIMLCTVVASLSFAIISPSNASAADCNDNARFLTFRPWYKGLCDSATGGIKKPGKNSTVTLEQFVGIIALNVLSILLNLVGYLAVGFIIYGGYLYILARGAPDNIARAKKVIMNAIVGLIIAILSAAIVNTIATQLSLA